MSIELVAVIAALLGIVCVIHQHFYVFDPKNPSKRKDKK